MNDPFFTIIIPTYERSHLLKETIDSVLVQSYDSWEAIVVDDGSPTRQTAARLGIHSQKIRWIRQENSGPALARQRGVELARGQYLCFLDDDDLFLPNHLATLYQSISAHTSNDLIFKTGIIHRTAGKPDKYCPLYPQEVVPLLAH